MSQISRILVPTDFSPASNIAADYAVEMASRYSASIVFVHVVDDGPFAASYPEGFSIERPGVQALIVAETERRLKVFEGKCANAGVTMSVQVLVGRAAIAIAAEATKLNADLIIMGTHGRNGLAHLMLGSVAKIVIRTAPCPVLTVRDTSRAAKFVDAAGAVARGQATPIIGLSA